MIDASRSSGELEMLPFCGTRFQKFLRSDGEKGEECHNNEEYYLFIAHCGLGSNRWCGFLCEPAKPV